MISSLSSFLEVAFAVYVSIFLDEKLGFNLWSPNVSPSLHKFLSQDEIWNETRLKDVVQLCVHNNLRKAYSGSRNAALLLIGVCLALLICVGFEYPAISDGNVLVMEIGMVLVLFLAILLLSSFKKGVLGIILIVVSAVAVFFICAWYFGLSFPECATKNAILRAEIVVVVSVPLLYHIVWFLLMKIKFPSYVEYYLSSELRILYKAKKLAQENSSGDCTIRAGGIPDEYLRASLNLYNEDNANQDANLNEFTTAFEESFQKKCPAPSFAILCRAKKVVRDTPMFGDMEETIPHASQES